MIGRRPDPRHPDDPNREVFAPFRYDRQTGYWVPVGGADAAFVADIDAGRVCMTHLQRKWEPIDKAARILRALCEHPAFEAFEADGIDGNLIRDAARELSLSIAEAGHEVERLLDEPGEDDLFYIRGKLYHANPTTDVLEPYDGDDEVPPVDDSDEGKRDEVLRAMNELARRYEDPEVLRTRILEVTDGDELKAQRVIESIFGHDDETSDGNVLPFNRSGDDGSEDDGEPDGNGGNP